MVPKVLEACLVGNTKKLHETEQDRDSYCYGSAAAYREGEKARKRRESVKTGGVDLNVGPHSYSTSVSKGGDCRVLEYFTLAVQIYRMKVL